MTHLRVSLTSLALTTVSLTLIGCGTGTTTQSSGPVEGSAFEGSVYGGSQPIIGAMIQLYAASTNGYGQPYTYAAGTSLLGTNVVTTGDNGGFSIGGGRFTCPAENPPVYLVATGGNPGLANGSNSSIALMAALGPCLGITTSTHIRIDEMTTVASVWSLSPFMSGIASVGTSYSNVTGLANAFATVNKLVDISVGNLPGPALPAGAVLPVQKMNLLADILASCVNSPGISATDPTAACNELFSVATVNGTAPTDTITAALNLAQNPDPFTTTAATTAFNNLLGKVSSVAPFQPVPSTNAEPTDLGLIIMYSGGALSTPHAIAADASGDLWVANAGNNTVSKLDALGVTPTDATGFLSGGTGFTAGSLSSPSAIALDQSGSAWVTNDGNNTVSRLSSDGTSATVYNGGSLSSPSGVAIDASGNAWIVNSGSTASVTEITPGTTPVYTNYPGTSVGIAAPTAIAINPK